MTRSVTVRKQFSVSCQQIRPAQTSRTAQNVPWRHAESLPFDADSTIILQGLKRSSSRPDRGNSRSRAVGGSGEQRRRVRVLDFRTRNRGHPAPGCGAFQSRTDPFLGRNSRDAGTVCAASVTPRKRCVVDVGSPMERVPNMPANSRTNGEYRWSEQPVNIVDSSGGVRRLPSSEQLRRTHHERARQAPHTPWRSEQWFRRDRAGQGGTVWGPTCPLRDDGCAGRV